MHNIFTKSVLEKFIKQAPELESAIRSVKMELHPTLSGPFEMLVKSVVYQQLSGKAASTIFERLMNLIGELTPEAILSRSFVELRSVGLSRQKASYLHNIAEAFNTNGHLADYNSVEALHGLSSDDICNLFSSIKGVGEWTVQMYLIFSLGRLDVLSPTDLGVRNGIKILYTLGEVPTPGQVKEITKHWHPLETVGTVLSWRILEKTRAENKN